MDSRPKADASAPMLTLKSREGRSFTVKKDVATQMQFVKDMLDDLEVQDGKEIPMGEIDATTLEKVIEFCTFHYENPIDRDTIEKIDKWERDFVNVEHHLLYRLILAANFVNMQPLLDLLCRTVADQIKGKTPDQIRTHFAITEEFKRGIEGN